MNLHRPTVAAAAAIASDSLPPRGVNPAPAAAASPGPAPSRAAAGTAAGTAVAGSSFAAAVNGFEALAGSTSRATTASTAASAAAATILAAAAAAAAGGAPPTRGFHTSTSQLSVNTFCEIHWMISVARNNIEES